MKKFYFTFGSGQPNADCYHVIPAENVKEARKEMFSKFGNKWSMHYDSAEEAGVKEFNLKEIK